MMSLGQSDITQPRMVKAGKGYRKVAALSDRIDATGDCWEWTGAIQGDGYGSLTFDSQPWLAHRFIWTAMIGPIPDGLTIDHLCQNRICVNPDHLETVRFQENVWRGSNPRYRTVKHKRCQNGHRYIGANIDRRGKTNRCYQCKLEYDRGR